MSAKQKKRRARAAVPPVRAAEKPAPNRFLWWGSLAVVVVAVVLSILRAPILPVNDPALYEFYGRRLLEGAHLYSDLPEVKLPSLYYVNALLQLAFGQNYLLHTCAEVALNVVAIVLFALLLRAYRLAAWAPATAFFAVVYSLGVDQFDFPEFFAVPLILLAYYLAMRRLEAGAGIALALATTFWVQTPILLVPLLTRRVRWREKLGAPLAFVLTFALAVLAAVPILGLSWINRPLSTWPSFLQGSLDAIVHPTRHIEGSLEATFLHAGIGALLALVLLVVRRPETEAQHFALWWTLSAFVGGMIPPSFYPWYFVPLMPAAVMVAAAFGLSRPVLVSRSSLAVVFCALVGYAAWVGVQDSQYVDRYAANVANVGKWIRVGLGSRVVLWTTEYLPELFLASGALEAASGTSNHAPPIYGEPGSTAGLQIAHWTRIPDLVADGGPATPPPARSKFVLYDPTSRASASYEPVCRGLGQRIRLYASPRNAELLGEQLKGC